MYPVKKPTINRDMTPAGAHKLDSAQLTKPLISLRLRLQYAGVCTCLHTLVEYIVPILSETILVCIEDLVSGIWYLVYLCELPILLVL